MRKTIEVKKALGMAFIYEGEGQHNEAIAIMNTVTWLATNNKDNGEKLLQALDLLDEYRKECETGIRPNSNIWADKYLALIA